MIPKLANIEFTKDDELEFCKKVLKDTRQQLARKTQECDELSKNSIGFAKKCQKLELEIFHLKDKNNVLTRQLDQLKVDINKKELIFAGIEVSNRELIKELNQLKVSKEQAEQKLKRIKQVCKDYCKIMCLCETKETCESCINTGILEIIDEVE